MESLTYANAIRFSLVRLRVLIYNGCAWLRARTILISVMNISILGIQIICIHTCTYT